MKSEFAVLSVCLPRTTLSRLDSIAKASSVKRAVVIRHAIDLGVEESARRFRPLSNRPGRRAAAAPAA